MAGSVGDCLHRPFNTDAFDLILGGPQARGIDDMQWHTVDMNVLTQDVPSGPCDIGDNRTFLARQGVEQAGLAGIGAAGDHHCHTVAQQRALPCLTLYLAQVLAYVLQLPQYVTIGKKVDFLLGKIDRRFHIDTQAYQGLGQGVHPCGKGALQ